MTAAARPAVAVPAPVAPPTGAPAHAVRLRGVSKSFPLRAELRTIAGALASWPPRWPEARWRRVLSDVTIEVRAGECLGLLGPNGAGKTTLFRLLMGMVLPDAGELDVLGATGGPRHPVPRAARAGVAYASVDERSLYWRLSAAENVALHVALYGGRGAEARRRVAEALALVGLDHTGLQAVGTFSSGMRQRLILARALALEPRVLLLDEPTRSLDPMTARDLRRFIRDEVVGRRACTVLLATHNSDEAMELCDRVAILDRGRLVTVDRAAALAERVGDGRLAVWTAEPRHPAFAELARERLAALDAAAPVAEGDGWWRVTLRVDGEDAAARVVARLGAAGVPVARVERAPLGLAELIERVTAREGR